LRLGVQLQKFTDDKKFCNQAAAERARNKRAASFSQSSWMIALYILKYIASGAKDRRRPRPVLRETVRRDFPVNMFCSA
jgi:hypothetical protein